MCFFSQKTPQPYPLPAPPPITSRTNQGLEADPLPDAKKVIDEDDVSAVEYGTARKKQTPALGKKKGAAALRVPLTGASGSGGSPNLPS